jgi:hypothetical protein
MRNAAREGNLEMLNVLLDAGADPNLCDAQGSYAPLHHLSTCLRERQSLP